MTSTSEPEATFSRVGIDPSDFCDGCGAGAPARGVCIHPPPGAPSRKAIILCARCAHGASNVVALATTPYHPARDARKFPGGQVRNDHGVLVVDE